MSTQDRIIVGKLGSTYGIKVGSKFFLTPKKLKAFFPTSLGLSKLRVSGRSSALNRGNAMVRG